jgi:uncharacterized SAM-binding protein YcdF (DUF218 family)
VTSSRSDRTYRGAAAGILGTLLIAFAVRYGGTMLVVTEPVEHPEAIVVLGSHEWERLPVAVQLARANPTARVWLTLPAEVTEHNCFQCAQRLDWLRAEGIGQERVTVLPQRVVNTYTEAAATAAFVGKQPVERLVIVTSAYHGRRALATFRQVFTRSGLRTQIGVATATSSVKPTHWWLRRYDIDYVTYEWAGIVYYALRFGVAPIP